jgi:hypothetical protein
VPHSDVPFNSLRIEAISYKLFEATQVWETHQAHLFERGTGREHRWRCHTKYAYTCEIEKGQPKYMQVNEKWQLTYFLP